MKWGNAGRGVGRIACSSGSAVRARGWARGGRGERGYYKDDGDEDPEDSEPLELVCRRRDVAVAHGAHGDYHEVDRIDDRQVLRPAE